MVGGLDVHDLAGRTARVRRLEACPIGGGDGERRMGVGWHRPELADPVAAPLGGVVGHLGTGPSLAVRRNRRSKQVHHTQRLRALLGLFGLLSRGRDGERGFRGRFPVVGVGGGT